ncbi:MAG: Protease HtpX [Candidatus Heimdallarchaeota archaeon AB_125]|nr:MAG: Protease HtpX [Candidatus Heimdallarchaeota archaeon AB_125]
MSLIDYWNLLWDLIKNDPNIGIGILIALLGLIFLISEIVTKIRHGTTSENLMLAFIALTFGLVLIFLSNWLIAIALSLFVLAVYQTYVLRESPVWRELMIISVVTYFVFLVGTVGDKVWQLVTGEKNELFTGWAYNIMLYVFIILALIFFGKKFVLVSRFMSPQVLYLTLFALVYVALYGVGKLIPGFDNLTWNFIGLISYSLSNFFTIDNNTISASAGNHLGGLVKTDSPLIQRTIFLSLGPWEMIILLSILMYFISGWLLTILLGIKPTDNKRVLKLVEEVRVRLGIKRKVKVGFVEAPILNAMAYGPLFDQRIALIASSLDEFSDDDIRGIVAHELAHNRRAHIVWLQILAWVEMIIKKAFLLPATTLDYAAVKGLIPFGWYFLISYGIIAVLYIFVRILEGDADLQTKKAGYGRELAQALYKLEGFYQGVAGDFGINVQLLTGKEFSPEEKQRFQGEAAMRLYKHLYRPGRWDMVANLFMSHPRTAYRIVAVVSDDYSPVKGALMPFWLILPNFIRGKAIKKLSKKREDFSKLISDRYTEYHGKDGVKSFLEITRMHDLISMLKGRYVVAYDRIFDDCIEGEITDIEISDTIVRPLLLNIQTETEVKKILFTDYVIHDALKNDNYILKNGKIGKLVSWEKEEKTQRPTFTFQEISDSSKTFQRDYTGKPISYFTELIGKEVFSYNDGLDRKAVLTEISFETNFASSKLILETDDNGKMKKFEVKGKDVIIDLPPVLVRLNPDKKDHQTSLIESIIDKSVILYTKEELETGIACSISTISDEKLTYKIKDKEFEIERKKVDYIYIYTDIPKFMIKKHISSLDRLLMRISNIRDMKYIFG